VFTNYFKFLALRFVGQVDRSPL